MTEHANPDDLSPLDAARELGRATRFEAGLRQRTEGLTWAFWAFAVSGIFLSYGLAEARLAAEWPLWAEHLWAPWVLAGYAFTWGLWRSAALAAPGRLDGGAWWPFLVSAALFVGGFALAMFLVPASNGQVVALMILGGATLFLGVTNILHYEPTGRRVALAAGAFSLTVALVEAYVGVTYETATLVAVLAGGGSFLAGGLYETLRG